MKGRALMITCAAALALVVPLSARQAPGLVSLQADLTGTLGGAAYIIKVPASWNGELLVFAHGTQLGSPFPVAAPVAAGVPPGPSSLEQQLLGMGYAIAGSGFRNSDKDGVQCTHALTGLFRETIGTPTRTMIWGNSLGGRIALELIEKYPGIYDGAIANGPPDAGQPENLDSSLSFTLAYAAAFGWPEAWGAIGDLRDDLNFDTEVKPIVVQQADLTNAANSARWEFVRLVMHLGSPQFYGSDPQINATVGTFPFFMLQMWKGTALRVAAEVENHGPAAQNAGTQYTLDGATAGELQSLGANGLDVESMLAFMNERNNIVGDKAARNHAEQWGGLSGKLRRPVLTMHFKNDGMAFVSNESYYKEIVEAAGAQDLLVQAYVNGGGHTAFTAGQYKAALAAMERWLDTAVKPDATLLTAANGFDLTFTPVGWRW